MKVTSNLLLDTHILFWLLNEPDKLDKTLVSSITDNNHIVFVSYVSIWEMSIKKKIGKLNLPLSLTEIVEKSGFNLLPIKLEHILAVENLPLHHRDPSDHMLIAQAQTEGLTLVTFDKKMQKYDVNMWGK